jgi:hypothetical protein
MGFGKAPVTDDLAVEPALLAAEGAFDHLANFAGGAVALALPGTQRFVLGGFFLDAVFNASRCFLLA